MKKPEHWPITDIPAYTLTPLLLTTALLNKEEIVKETQTDDEMSFLCGFFRYQHNMYLGVV